MNESRIEQVPVSTLKPYRNNARTHTEDQIEKIGVSIERFGFLNPIIANKETRTILAGHGRFMAAAKLGMTTVPVVWVNGLKNERAYIIADNRLAEDSFWDNRMLTEALRKLNSDQVHATGMTDAEVSALADSILPQFDFQDQDGEEGDEGEEEAPSRDEADIKVYDVKVKIGEFQVSMPKVRYDAMVRELRERFLFDKDAITKEIRRRLGL